MTLLVKCFVFNRIKCIFYLTSKPRYADTEPFVLKGLTFETRPSEKVGIVGRTGAGKSSLITALFRLAEPVGEIRIDGVNVLEIGLRALRSSISIIPQDPLLFTGTLRRNLDPFDEYTDDRIWGVLGEVHLSDAVSDLKLGKGRRQKMVIRTTKGLNNYLSVLLCPRVIRDSPSS